MMTSSGPDVGGSLVARLQDSSGVKLRCGLVGKVANKKEGQRASYLNRAQEAETIWGHVTYKGGGDELQRVARR